MKKDAQYFETVIIGTDFFGFAGGHTFEKNNSNDFIFSRKWFRLKNYNLLK